MSDKPRKKRPNMEIWSDQPTQGPQCYQDLLDFVEDQLAEELDDALHKAITNHQPFNTAHEGYAVILEELDELWDEVKAWQPNDHRTAQLRKEAIHVAAMAIRFIKDVCDKEPVTPKVEDDEPPLDWRRVDG